MTTQAYIKSIEAENELLRDKIEAYERAFDIMGKHAFIDPNASNEFMADPVARHARLCMTVESCYLTQEEFDILSKFIIVVAAKRTARDYKKTP